MMRTVLVVALSFAPFIVRPVVSFTLPNAPSVVLSRPSSSSSSVLCNNNNANNNDDDAERARLEVWADRRRTVRTTLRSAESLRNYRIANDLVESNDPDGDGDDGADARSALTATAFVVAGGAVLLRVGGRAALVSSLGLDVAVDNPELGASVNDALAALEALPPETKAIAFLAGWTFVKVFCFDAGGVALALSAGVLFGGVIQGALASAAAATIGSTVAFGLAKMDSPIRQKALDLLEEFPSLRGIEKVVARDGIKAVLTLRLAPVLPIPIGAYNYVYGVTNVPLTDFMAGIFLGSIKPYLLDSYLGSFGKSLLDGTGSRSDTEDSVLLVALGVSVLIGVFASQLASETWDEIVAETEAEKAAASAGNDGEEDDDVARSFLGFDLPAWVVGAQLTLRAAERRIEETIRIEAEAAVWNFTEPSEIPVGRDPAGFDDAPEVAGRGAGFDVVAALAEGLVLSPVLLRAFFQYADPAYDVEAENAKPKTESDSGSPMTESFSPIVVADEAVAVDDVDAHGRLSSTSYLDSLNDGSTTVYANGEGDDGDDDVSATRRPQPPTEEVGDLDAYLFETLHMIRTLLETRMSEMDSAKSS